MVGEKPTELIHQTAREHLFTRMYASAFPSVSRFVATHGGTIEDAKDIFQDALVIYYELLTEKKVHIEVSERAYITGIAKHVWLRKYKKVKSTVSLDSLEQSIRLPESYYEPHDERLLALLENAGQRCVDLLKAFYYDKLSLDSISAAFGFSGVRSATVQKFKCIEKMRTIVKQNSITYEDLLD